MTRDDIIRIYMQVSDEFCEGREWCWAGVGEPLQRFAALVAAAEREACAKVCDEIGGRDSDSHAWDAAAAIRARGET